MKNYKSLLTIMLVIMICIGFDSCEKNEFYNSTFLPSDLVGTWDCTESVDYWDGGSKEGSLVGKYLIIYNNGTYSSNSSTVYSGYYTLSSNKLTIRSNRGRRFEATANMDGSKKKMQLEGSTDDGYTFKYTFKKRY